MKSHDLTNRPFGLCYVVGPAARKSSHGLYWTVVCKCGAHFEARTSTLLNSSASYCCQTCRPRSGFGRGAGVPACGICHQSGHSRRSCPERGKEPDRCRRCEGLPWRRDVPHCARCHEPHAPEPPVMIADVMEQPRENGRSYPDSDGGFRL